MFSEMIFAVSELAASIAGECDKEHRGCQQRNVRRGKRVIRIALITRADLPGRAASQSPAKERGGRDRDSAPHVLRDESPFETAAPCEEPTQIRSCDGAQSGQAENETRRRAKLIPPGIAAGDFQYRNQQQQGDRQVSGQGVKVSKELRQIAAFLPIRRDENPQADQYKNAQQPTEGQTNVC